MTRPLAITFDVYGTLVRWDETVAAIFREILADQGAVDADIGAVAHAFEAESRRLQTVGAFRSYRNILRDSVVPALKIAGLDTSAGAQDRVVGALSRIAPFPEVPGVLQSLATGGHRLAPISNTDDELLAGTLDGLGPVFVTTVTAEQARAYKPNPGLFRFAFRKLGLEPAQVLHVAQGTFSDLALCSALEVRVVWVNREGTTLQDGLKPIAVIDDITALPDLVAAL